MTSSSLAMIHVCFLNTIICYVTSADIDNCFPLLGPYRNFTDYRNLGGIIGGIPIEWLNGMKSIQWMWVTDTSELLQILASATQLFKYNHDHASHHCLVKQQHFYDCQIWCEVRHSYTCYTPLHSCASAWGESPAIRLSCVVADLA